MTSASGNASFLASPAERAALQQAVQRVQSARLASEPTRRVDAPVAAAGGAPGEGAVGRPAATEAATLQPVTSAPGGSPSEGRPAAEGERQGEKGSFSGVRQEGELSAEERKQVEELKSRDKEVRAHEAAHKSAGGQYVRGSASFDYQTGPDGKRYAIGGEVKIDTGKEDEPEKSLEKAEAIRRAAMAPAEPSDKDRQVAADASRMASEARMEIAQTRAAEARGESPEEKGEAGISSEGATSADGDGEGAAAAPGLNAGEGEPGAGRRASAGGAAYGALNQFNLTANAGRSNNLFVNVYA